MGRKKYSDAKRRDIAIQIVVNKREYEDIDVLRRVYNFKSMSGFIRETILANLARVPTKIAKVLRSQPRTLK